MVLFHGLSFSLWFKMIDPGFICCNNPGWDAISLTFKTCLQLRKNSFPLGFVFDCETPRNPSYAHLRIFKISNDVTNTSFADHTTECLLLGCDASILAKDGITTLQHFRTNSCDRTVWARQIMELWFSCCRSYLFLSRNQPCFCWPQHFHKHCKDVCGCFSPNLSQ
jgi:hypothetical protein